MQREKVEYNTHTVFDYTARVLIIRISLLLILASLPVFLAVELLLRLKVPGLPSALTALGSVVLLSGFALLLVAGLIGICKIIVGSSLSYFSVKQRLQRRLWFVERRQEELKCLFFFKVRQIHYFNELHKKRLLKRNNCQYIRLLSRSINKDLLAIKTKLSETTYRQLQQDHVRYKNTQDIEALLSLQQKIATLI